MIRCSLIEGLTFACGITPNLLDGVNRMFLLVVRLPGIAARSYVIRADRILELSAGLGWAVSRRCSESDIHTGNVFLIANDAMIFSVKSVYHKTAHTSLCLTRLVISVRGDCRQ